MMRFGGALLLALAAAPAHAAYVLDGKLDEPEWQQAQKFDDFKMTEPNIGSEPEYKTTVLVYTDDDGLHVGVVSDQPASLARSRTRGQRDQFVTGDRINLIVDFDGSGTTAYELTAYLGGGEKQDAFITRQVNYNYDWDGDWDYAVSETKDQWTVEYRIPWNIAPMSEPKDGKQTIGLFVSRFVVATGQRYAVPGNSLNRGTFVSDMRKVQIAAHEHAHLELFPYGAVSRDVLTNDTRTRAGIDVFWKPNGRQQLTATINPDFGQVENDQLVVNLTAIPTFYPDKRPFFTENLGLFTTDINVLYTRRIGAKPDCTGGYYCVPPEPTTDIKGALKYTGTSGAADYGLITAWEDDTSQAQGRDFYVGRARYRVSPGFSFGWMGTHTERPTLDRTADTNALDFAWTLADGVSLTGQSVVDHVTQHDPNFFDPAGTGMNTRLQFRYGTDAPYENYTVLVYKTQGYNINDAGYQMRPSEWALQTLPTYYWRNWAADSAIQQTSITTNWLLHGNDSGDLLQGSAITNFDWTRKDTRSGGFEYDLFNVGGQDDVVTCGFDVTVASCGHAPAKLPVKHTVYAYYNSPRVGLFRYTVVTGAGTGNFVNHGWYYTRVEPGFFPSETISITSSLAFTQSPDEIVSWRSLAFFNGTSTANEDDVLGTFDYNQQDVSVDVNWFPVPHHELRIRTQWSAYSLDPLQAYRPAPNGDLYRSGEALAPYNGTQTALQMRYRWEFAPQSDLYFVYTHGGEEQLVEPEHNMGASLRRGFAVETASEFLLKVRYRFVVL